MRTGLSTAMIAAAMALALIVDGASAQTPQPEARLLTATGVGTVQARPDVATITLGVVSEDESASAALAANSGSLAQVLDALKGQGMEERDLQTSGFALEAVYSQPPRDYDPSKPFLQEIVGYRVRNNVTVRVRDLERVGQVLDQVVQLGANSISGPTFTVDDTAPLEDRARVGAVQDALRKGHLLANAAGISLGPIVKIEESYARQPQPFAPAMMRMEAGADSSVPIEAGELTFEAQVLVSWELGE